MTLAIYQDWVADSFGNTIWNASVEVRRESDNALASIYSDRAGAVAVVGSTVFTDSTGYFSFFAAGGRYKLTIRYGDVLKIMRYVAIGTAQEGDATAAGLDLINSPVTANASGDVTGVRALTTTGSVGIGTAAGSNLCEIAAGAGITPFYAHGNSGAAVVIDYLGGGANYYTAALHQFRDASYVTQLAIQGGNIVCSGSLRLLSRTVGTAPASPPDGDLVFVTDLDATAVGTRRTAIAGHGGSSNKGVCQAYGGAWYTV